MTRQQLRAIIANNVRERRLAAHMKQGDLALACSTTQARISLIEGGKARCDDEILALLGDALGVHPASLMMDAPANSQKSSHRKNLKIGA